MIRKKLLQCLLIARFRTPLRAMGATLVLKTLQSLSAKPGAAELGNFKASYSEGHSGQHQHDTAVQRGMPPH